MNNTTKLVSIDTSTTVTADERVRELCLEILAEYAHTQLRRQPLGFLDGPYGKLVFYHRNSYLAMEASEAEAGRIRDRLAAKGFDVVTESRYRDQDDTSVARTTTTTTAMLLDCESNHARREEVLNVVVQEMTNTPDECYIR